MPKLRRLSGAEIVAILGRFGFTIHDGLLPTAQPRPSRSRHTMNWTRERAAQSSDKPAGSYLKKISVHISTPPK